MLLSLVCGGCGDQGPPLAPVTGTVTLVGQPLTGATVIFEPEQGKTSRAITDSAGRYDLVYLPGQPGAVVGSHTVRITTWSEQTPQERLPARYHSRSELHREVEEGGASFDFELTSSEVE